MEGKNYDWLWYLSGYYLCLGIAGNLFYAGRGGAEYGPGVLLFAALWSALNVLGIIFWGTGLGL